MSVNPQPARNGSAPEPTAPVKHPEPTPVTPLMQDALDFVESAFSGEITPEDDAGGETLQDVGEATPATPGPEPAEVAAEVERQPPPRREGSRREREAAARKAAEPATPAPAPETPAPAHAVPSREEIIAEHERQQAEIRARAEAEARERTVFAEWTGDVPADPANPSGQTRYQQLQQTASQMLPAFDVDTATTDDLRVHNAKVAEINAARAQLERHDFVRGFLDRFSGERIAPVEQKARGEALAWVGNQFEGGLAETGLDVQAILRMGQGAPEPMKAIVKGLAQSLRSQIEAEYKPRITELEEDAAAKDSEIDALRRQLGGRAPQPERGGQPITAPSGDLSLEALDAVPLNQLEQELQSYLAMIPAASPRRR